MAYYAVITTTLAVLSFVAVAAALLLGAGMVVPAGRARMADALRGQGRHPIGWAWFVAVLAMSGSLYLSDVVGLAPCLFCWYQRIAMYPLVLVLGVGMIRGDTGVWRYGLPLAVVGAALSAYHVALQFRPTLDVGACQGGVPCSARYLAIFGFVSIPVMAGAAFLLIIAFLLLVRLLDRADEG